MIHIQMVHTIRQNLQQISKDMFQKYAVDNPVLQRPDTTGFSFPHAVSYKLLSSILPITEKTYLEHPILFTGLSGGLIGSLIGLIRYLTKAKYLREREDILKDAIIGTVLGLAAGLTDVYEKPSK